MAEERGITTARALELLEGAVEALEAEPVPLAEAAGRVLARPFFAPGDVPPFSRAAMDGYAVRAADVAGASAASPRALRVQGRIMAGEVAREPLAPGAAYRVATGAQLPPGADAVVRQEVTALEDGGERVLVYRPVEPERDVVRQGVDVAAGQLLFPAGWILHANDLGLLASFGLNHVEVVRRPRVAYVETGNELVPPGLQLPPGHIYGSNSLVLAARAREHGAQVVAQRRVGDDLDEVRACFADVAVAADVVVSTGGVSVGPLDVVPAALESLGFRTLFRGLRLMPGRPTMVAVGRGVVWFALSGNPAAALITHELFVRPVLWRMAGWCSPHGFSPAVRARLKGHLPERKGRPRYYLARLQGIGGEPVVEVDQRHRATGLAAPFPFNAVAEIPPRRRFLRDRDGKGDAEGDGIDARAGGSEGAGGKAEPIGHGERDVEVTVYVADRSLVAALGSPAEEAAPSPGRAGDAGIPRRDRVVLAFCGHSGSGKTTLMTRLIPRLRERGWHVAVVKHGHRFDLDRPGKDSWRFRQAGARAVVMASAHEAAYLGETGGPAPLDWLLELAEGPAAARADVLLLEGFKAVPVPKVLVLRDDEVYREHPLAGDPHVQAVYGGLGGEEAPVPAFPRVPQEAGEAGEDDGIVPWLVAWIGERLARTRLPG